MYAIAILRYRRPLDEILPYTDAHRAHLRVLKEQGILLAGGPLDPRFGGALLLRVSDGEGASALDALDRVRDSDPYVLAGVVQYEILPWAPVIGKEDLDLAFPVGELRPHAAAEG
jgi:uncharacterized protein YciI